MREQSWIVVSAMLAGAAPWACSQVQFNTTAAGTGGSSSQSSAHASGVVTSTGAGGLDCTGILQMGPCDDCLQASCCVSYADCANDSDCFNCVFAGSTDAVCMDPTTTALSTPFLTCAQASCDSECFPPPPPDPACDAPVVSPSMGSCYTAAGCNPVSNAGCQPGEACDATSKGGFQCFGPPPANTGMACGTCDNQAVACAGGLTCGGTGGQCIKFCCDDGDCGSGKCDKQGTTNSPDVGVCVAGPAPDGGTGDGGTDAGNGDAGAGDAAAGDAGDGGP